MHTHVWIHTCTHRRGYTRKVGTLPMLGEWRHGQDGSGWCTWVDPWERAHNEESSGLVWLVGRPRTIFRASHWTDAPAGGGWKERISILGCQTRLGTEISCGSVKLSGHSIHFIGITKTPPLQTNTVQEVFCWQHSWRLERRTLFFTLWCRRGRQVKLN